jgi:molybdopterin-guanine dinucleotide biosynthesis protein A
MIPRYNAKLVEHRLYFGISRPSIAMRKGAIILCGGQSTRMGRDKATLSFGPEMMLQRVVRLIGDVVPIDHIVVVAAASQSLPPLPGAVGVARDDRPERGPLEGMAAGFGALAKKADVVYVTSCDVPLLVPAFVERMFDLLGDHGIAVPRDGEFHHPLAAVYRSSVLRAIETLLAADRLRLRDLLGAVRTREIPVEELRGVDPDLSTLRNVNLPADYTAALHAAGFPTPP